MTSPIADPLAALAGIEGVGSAVMAARDAVDAVLRDRGRRQITSEQQAEALLMAARASAVIGRTEDDHVGDDDHRSWEAGTLRLYVELVDLARLIRVSPGQAIARAHAVLGRGVLADDGLGRLRDDSQVADRMAALGRLLTTSTSAPVIVVAAIAHAELITVAPFAAGNGIVARAVERMILIDGDLDRPAVTVPEVAHQQSGAAYRLALEGYRSGSAQGVRDWLLHVAAAVTRGAELSPLKPVRQPPGRRP
ncbi:oxidoreductase [Microlunatus endophyticus]|uniref:Oxidoreductase n=1 Tax=Microlunatus endophyticus TaxID=1716077 RepID=A0A917SI35_9ACTN|nr:Fic family protein [Microlunatus endophyticus]GGL81257.1 oxidoreductase [Microlunatus endophyticus]